MEDRLLKFLDTEQLSSSKFADVISVQRSSVSHILSGRNKPSFDFLQKTLKAFPLLNADWLILGEGNMYEDMNNYVSGGLFAQAAEDISTQSLDTTKSSAENVEKSNFKAQNAGDISKNPVQDAYLDNSEGLTPKLEVSRNLKKITKVILFYEDNSFHTYEPES